MIIFADPEPEHLIQAVCDAIPRCRKVDPLAFHDELKDMYNWPDVAERTVRVYESVMATPRLPLIEIYRRNFGVGRLFGLLTQVMITILYFIVLALEVLQPREDVDIVPALPLSMLETVETSDTVSRDYEALSRTVAFPPLRSSEAMHIPAATPRSRQGSFPSDGSYESAPSAACAADVPLTERSDSGASALSSATAASSAPSSISRGRSATSDSVSHAFRRASEMGASRVLFERERLGLKSGFDFVPSPLNIRAVVETASDGTVQATPTAYGMGSIIVEGSGEDEEFAPTMPGIALKTPLHRAMHATSAPSSASSS
ncbi:hypothetical protein EON67_02860 [archaeon]|nr:MAG: hypothetical protein EON67_02860 [archaeon]